MSFFTESWRNNSFHKQNYTTVQTVQMFFFGAQLYMALIALIGGGSVPLLSVILAMLVAGAYSFFSPTQVAAVDSLQSNGAQLAVLGASTYSIVAGAGGSISFYVLFCLMAVETIMSCSSFFQEH